MIVVMSEDTEGTSFSVPISVINSYNIQSILLYSLCDFKLAVMPTLILLDALSKHIHKHQGFPTRGPQGNFAGLRSQIPRYVC